VNRRDILGINVRASSKQITGLRGFCRWPKLRRVFRVRGVNYANYFNKEKIGNARENIVKKRLAQRIFNEQKPREFLEEQRTHHEQPQQIRPRHSAWQNEQALHLGAQPFHEPGQIANALTGPQRAEPR
jgi:hypothetical protein